MWVMTVGYTRVDSCLIMLRSTINYANVSEAISAKTFSDRGCACVGDDCRVYQGG